ncbi:MAG: N-Acetyl-D-glucosamine transport system, permease protein 1 [Bacteroidetes bacterium]|nr:N-Acetyl-D-glucosamine transport system, permease protein 1 [Bacteroidota bacterium]
MRPTRTFRVLEPYLYLLPTLIGLALFSAGAVAVSFLMSFTHWDIITTPEWIWLENYITLWQSDLFWEVVWNTVYFILLAVPLSVVASLALALAANTTLKGIVFFRTAYFLPVVSSMIAVALVWSWIYNPEYGLLNYLLDLFFGIRGPAWLDSTSWALPAMVIVTVWKGLGYSMVIFLAGLQNIPQDLYHAATIDGAGVWKKFRHITLPMLSPTTFFVIVITLINSFQVFEQTYVLTKGGPANSTLTMSYYIYQNAFQFFQMGKAAALSYVLFAAIFVVTLIQFRIQKRWVFYG